LVEGAYACHPALWDHYDLRLFLPVEPQVQLERLRRRCPERLGAFEEKWIPLERAYFAAYRLPERCDLILT
ncbi:MAG: uridine kinase, partial [Oscillospiraceae bacterium]|nr:uridine kinase [Oscillospiraceae bacterium]